MTKKRTNEETNSSIEQAFGQSVLSKMGYRLMKVSRYFGWPVLLAFLLGPPATVGAPQLLKLFFVITIPVALSAVVLRWWSFGFVREKHFVVNGPFRYVRNPVELSCLLGYVAGGILLALPGWYIGGLVLMSAFYMSFASIAYEETLLQRYASKYERYRQRVRRWIPLSLPATNAEKQDFSIGRAFFFDRWGWIWFLSYCAVYAIRSRWTAPFWGGTFY